MARRDFWISQLCFIMLISVSVSVSDALGHSEIHEKIHYHLRELNHGLKQLKASKSHDIHKRSISNHDELIYNSLVAFCGELSSHDGFSTTTKSKETTTPTPSTVTGLKSLVIPPPKLTDIPESSPASPWPHLFPLKVRAGRDGPSVWLVFDVVHTASVLVSRYYSFDVQNVLVDYPDSLSASPSPPPVTSMVRLEVDASMCENVSRPYDHHTASIGFTLSEKQLYMVTISINLCMFDYYYNDTSDNDDGEWEAKKEIITETISPPAFEITSPDPSDEIVLSKGQDVALDLDVDLTGYLGMVFSVRIWDRRVKGKLLKSTIRIGIDNGTVKAFPAESKTKNLLSVEILEQIKVKSSQSGGNNGKGRVVDSTNEGGNFKIKVRVTVDTSVGRRSGKLFISYSIHRYNNYDVQNVVELLSTEKIILLKLPRKTSVWPKHYVEIRRPDRPFKCDSDGIKGYAPHGKNCTINCYAYGVDIKDIFISDTRPQRRPPIRSVSRVDEGGNSAFSMIDVGPASNDVEGTYRCTAITSNGKKIKEDLKLFTSLFTKVFYNMTIVETVNFTAVVRCSAFGAQPLNMSLFATANDYVSDHRTERVDNQTYIRRITTNGYWRNLTVELSIHLLMNPNVFIICEASGERGTDSVLQNLSDYDIDSPPLPRVNHDPKFSNITVGHNNGLAEIYCEARGDEPLEFSIRNGIELVGKTPESVRTVAKTPRGKMLSFFVRTKDLDFEKPVSCHVKNSQGEVEHTLFTT